MATYDSLLLLPCNSPIAFDFSAFEDFAQEFLAYQMQGTATDEIELLPDVLKNIPMCFSEGNQMNSLATIIEEKDVKVDMSCTMDCGIDSSLLDDRNANEVELPRAAVNKATKLTGNISSSSDLDCLSENTITAANELNRMSLDEVGRESDGVPLESGTFIFPSNFVSSTYLHNSSEATSCPTWNSTNLLARTGISDELETLGCVFSPVKQPTNRCDRPNFSHLDAVPVKTHLQEVPLSTNLPVRRSHSSHALGRLSSLATQVPLNANQSHNLSPRLRPHDAAFVSKPDLSYLQEMSSRASIGSMRRVYSTGDLQTVNGMETFHGGRSPLLMENSRLEEVGMKIGHCTFEERKIKLHRYRQKRMERNFNKKIKYACRKVLADGRQRIRGRFARTDFEEQ